MIDRFCPLRPPDPKGIPELCHAGCAWLLPDGSHSRCVITWLPRLTEAIEAQTQMVKALLTAGIPGFPPEGH